MPSRIRDCVLAIITDGGCGQGASVVVMECVKKASASFRWSSFLLLMRERLWLKSALASRLPSVRLCCLRTIASPCQYDASTFRVLARHTFCSKAGIRGVGVFWSRFSNLQLFLLEVLFPLILVLVGFRHRGSPKQGRSECYRCDTLLPEKDINVFFRLQKSNQSLGVKSRSKKLRRQTRVRLICLL